MQTLLLTGDDMRFLAQQPEYEVNTMLGQMTTLMQNITSLQNDSDDKVKQLENQNWFKRMTSNLLGKNKATRQEIQKNSGKMVEYISQSVAQLYNMNLINERVISSLGNRMNEVYVQVVESNQEMLNMKGQISEIMQIQQQTIEAMGAFVNKLNEKIESVDNFHMLISEIQNGIYNDSSKLYNLCSILSQLDKRQMDDNRKMNLLNDTMIKSNIITQDEFSVLQCLQEIVALPQEKVGLIYLELCNFRNSFPADMFADMIENYHFLSKMEKMSKKKETLIQNVIDKYELDADATFSIADISESFFENKQASFVCVDNIKISANEAKNNNAENVTVSASTSSKVNEPWDLDKAEKIISEFEKNDEPEKVYNYLLPYAEQGVAAAQRLLGMCYEFGEGIDEDENKAFEWYKKAAEQGFDYGEYEVGRCFYFGFGVKKDIHKALEWFKRAFIQNLIESIYYIGECYIELNNFTEALKWYRKGAEKNDTNCQNAIGVRYFNGEGVKKSNPDAFFWFRRAAENGNALGERNLGYCYMNGFGTSKNLDEAERWLRKAVEDGDESAQELLDELGVAENGYDSSNKTEASLRYWAENGDLDAMEDLGYALYYGEHDDDFGVDGIEEDKYKAALYLEKAAKSGMKYSQYKFANMCYYGEGVAQNYQRALKWYKKAAEQGNGWACFSLYKMYSDGLGCSEDSDIAWDYYCKACDILNDGDEICPSCGSSDYYLEETSTGIGKGAAAGAAAGAIFGLIGAAAGAAAGAIINHSTITKCTCNDCNSQWKKIFK